MLEICQIVMFLLQSLSEVEGKVVKPQNASLKTLYINISELFLGNSYNIL